MTENDLLPLCTVIADDHADHANSLAAVVETWGHFTHVVQDAQEALKVCRQYRPDVLLLDIGLPLRTDGLAVAREIRRSRPQGDLAIAAITGHDDPDTRREAAEAGFDYFLVKPVDLQRLHDYLVATQKEHQRLASGSSAPLGTPAKTSSEPQKSKTAGTKEAPGP